MIVKTRKWRRTLRAYSNAWLEGYTPKGFTVESDRPFGRPAHKLIKHVQDNLVARDLLPKASADGTLNQKTQDALIPPHTFADKAVAYALSQRGKHEDPWGSNRGTDVRRYQSSTGEYNVAWCASFVWYCWQQAGYRGATSAGAWNTTDHYGTPVADLNHAIPGDLVSLDEGEGHVGMLLSRDSVNITLISGNTHNAVDIGTYPIGMIHSICRPHVVK